MMRSVDATAPPAIRGLDYVLPLPVLRSRGATRNAVIPLASGLIARHDDFFAALGISALVVGDLVSLPGWFGVLTEHRDQTTSCSETFEVQSFGNQPKSMVVLPAPGSGIRPL